MPRPSPLGGFWPPSARGGRPVPWSTVTHVWKSHVCTRMPLGRAEADVDDRGGHEARAAGVLDRHLDAELDRDVADQRRARDPADALELHRDAVGDPVALGPQEVVQRHDRLVEDERPVARGPYRCALGVGAARLLERVLEIPRCPQEAPRAPAVKAPFASAKSTMSVPTASRTAASLSASASGSGPTLTWSRR